MLCPVNLASDSSEILGQFQEVAEYFCNDHLPHPCIDPSSWLDYCISLILEAKDWFFVRKHNHKVTGAIWAHNWQGYHKTLYSCEISGFSARGVSIKDNLADAQEFLKILFSAPQLYQLYVVRAVIDANNIAARRLLKRLGFSYPETQRAAYIKNNVEHTVIIMSMTRPEYATLCANSQNMPIKG